jgi:hypothetical protein
LAISFSTDCPYGCLSLTARAPTQVNHGYRLTDELAARVAELEAQVNKAGVRPAAGEILMLPVYTYRPS